MGLFAHGNQANTGRVIAGANYHGFPWCKRTVTPNQEAQAQNRCEVQSATSKAYSYFATIKGTSSNKAFAR